jgi:hypothetical protein
MNYSSILVDSCAFVSFYNKKDSHHDLVHKFFQKCTSQLITTTACITEAIWLLNFDYRAQNEFLEDLISEIYIHESLTLWDFSRIAELNEKYADRRADFADLSLVAISERLDIPAIATFDKDFQVYRRYRNQPFVNVLA